MKIRVTLICLLLFLPALAVSAQGMVNVDSDYDVDQTAERLVNILNAKGMTIFNQVEHSKAAANVGIELRDTRLVIFGNPKIGSKLMQCAQSVAIDLPQKALIWKDGDGKVWLSYNDPAYLKDRHQMEGCDPVLDKVSKALNGITSKAATKD